MKYFFAPVQGHTDAPYRHFHNTIYGGDLLYYTPFIRLEKGDMRPKDLKDFLSPLNSPHEVVPQIIFRDAEELNALVGILRRNGAKTIDLNMGCPFPLQTGHGRGAAAIANPGLGKEVADVVKNNTDISFSVKMRLGLSEPEEWKTLMPQLNDVNLSHIAVHPRIARQQYSGELHMDQFSQIVASSHNPIVFNGDIRTPADAARIVEGYPDIAGIMIGRGLLARPSLATEIAGCKESPQSERIEKMLRFHQNLYDHYESTLCGESQLISKIKPFWEYAEEEIGRKAWKAIKKSTNIAKYNSAVAMIG